MAHSLLEEVTKHMFINILVPRKQLGKTIATYNLKSPPCLSLQHVPYGHLDSKRLSIASCPSSFLSTCGLQLKLTVYVGKAPLVE